MKTYRFYGLAPYWSLLVLGALTAGAPFVAAGVWDGGGAFNLIWLAILAFFWYHALVLEAYKVDLGADDVLHFRSVLRRRAVPIARLREVRSSSGSPTEVVFKYDGGTVRLLQPSGVLELLTHIKQINPAVDLKGF